jgi:regulatory protein
MVRFIDPNENDAAAGERSGSTAAREGDKLATVTYLPGAAQREFPDVTPEADPESVEAALVKKLARRALSEAEVLSFGMDEGLTAHQANSVLDHLRDLGYVDDRVLAEQLKHALYERKGQSKSVVARAMSGRSIDREIIDEVLDDIDSGDELSAATELAAKRASQLTGLDKQTLERRLVGFLARRGYPGNIVREAIAPLLSGRSNPKSSTVRFR